MRALAGPQSVGEMGVGDVVVVGDSCMDDKEVLRAHAYTITGMFHLPAGAAPQLNAAARQTNRLSSFDEFERLKGQSAGAGGPPAAGGGGGGGGGGYGGGVQPDLWVELFSMWHHSPEGEPVACRASQLELRTVPEEVDDALGGVAVPIVALWTGIFAMLSYGRFFHPH